MTFEEVYKQVCEYLQYYTDMNEGEPNFQKAVDYYKIIKRALDKQISKKVDMIGNVFDDLPWAWVCPNCNEIVEPHSHHCSCGQTLDWSEEIV